jgi:hypothetical protein
LSRAAHVKVDCVLGLNILIDSEPEEEALLQPEKQNNPIRAIARKEGIDAKPGEAKAASRRGWAGRCSASVL